MKTFKEAVDEATEASLYLDQREIETAVLQILASVINSDLSEVKNGLLELRPEEFGFQEHGAIFAAMKSLYDNGDIVNLITVRSRIQETWKEEIDKIFNGEVPDERLAHTYAKQIKDWAFFRRLRKDIQSFSSRLEKLEGPEEDKVEEVVSKLQGMVFDLSLSSRLAAIHSEADLIDKFVLELQSPQQGYDTGFEYLNKTIGGLRPSLITLAGPPSAGKTTFVKQLVDQVAELNSVPIIFFSFEQSAAELRIKSLARITRKRGKPLENEEIKKGNFSIEELNKVAEEYKQYGKFIKIIEGDIRHTIEKIRRIAQIEKRRNGKAPVVVLDYLQVVPTEASFSGDRRGAIDYIVSELRRTARELESPIIALSSMNRNSYDNGGKVTMSVFKESGGIEYGADIAMVLVADAIPKAEGEATVPETERPVSLLILKNRWGLRQKISFAYEVKQDFFTEQTHEDISYRDAVGDKRQ